jgi:ribulose bisphosphate carboxylase small subunit
MNTTTTTTTRRPSGVGSAPAEKKAVPLDQDSQLQALLSAGWEIAHEGANEIRLTKPGGRKLAHKRKRV